MEPKLHRRVQRYGWDKAVENYGDYFVPLLKHCSERCMELLDLRPGERALDVATGTGVAAFMAAERVGPSGEVWRPTSRRKWWSRRRRRPRSAV